jgi:16S rRNA (cytosine1402-N4)-methyltransferase
MAAEWGAPYGDRMHAVQGTFGDLDSYADAPLDGVTLDLGVSSMQLDRADRGFSFMKDGPLDMRMAQTGPSAADLVNDADERDLADILFQFGEERASRRIAKHIVAERTSARIETTGQLERIVSACLPRAKPGQSHAATRTFQALRIAVNDEFGELLRGLEVAERALKPGGRLAVVTFHSLEDRIVKRFFQDRAGQTGRANRHAPEVDVTAPRFNLTVKGTGPDVAEQAANPRARSARLRVGTRTDAPAGPPDRTRLGLPKIALEAL